MGQPDAALGRGRAEAESRGEPRALTAGGQAGRRGNVLEAAPAPGGRRTPWARSSGA